MWATREGKAECELWLFFTCLYFDLQLPIEVERKVFEAKAVVTQLFSLPSGFRTLLSLHIKTNNSNKRVLYFL